MEIAPAWLKIILEQQQTQLFSPVQNIIVISWLVSALNFRKSWPTTNNEQHSGLLNQYLQVRVESLVSEIISYFEPEHSLQED